MKNEQKHVSWDKFSRLYCETQVQTPEGLRRILQSQALRFSPEGWFILECVQLDSSCLGERVILPYGPNNTFKEPPTHPVSPRGLASDMSTVKAVLLIEDFNHMEENNAS